MFYLSNFNTSWVETKIPYYICWTLQKKQVNWIFNLKRHNIQYNMISMNIMTCTSEGKENSNASRVRCERLKSCSTNLKGSYQCCTQETHDADSTTDTCFLTQGVTVDLPQTCYCTTWSYHSKVVECVCVQQRVGCRACLSRFPKLEGPFSSTETKNK